jgi:hypothetical protein
MDFKLYVLTKSLSQMGETKEISTECGTEDIWTRRYVQIRTTQIMYV